MATRSLLLSGRGLRDKLSSKLAAPLRTRRASLLVPLLFLAVLFGAIALAILVLNDGQFLYSLDDAYIHLALAENIARGHYGVNAGEVSAPSSSILWPFLLAPFTLLSLDVPAVLGINLLAALATVYVFHRILVAALEPGDEPRRNFAVLVLTAFLILATNLLGLLFTGLEHSVQVLLAATLVLGILREQQTDKVPWYLLLAVVAGPLIRYENLALAAPALLYLLWKRHYVAAFGSGIVLAGSLAAFSLFLYAQGLGIVPTSVLAKSATLSGGRLGSLVRSLYENVQSKEGALLSIGLLGLVFALLRSRSTPNERALATWAGVAVVLHMLIGRFGWYARYEIYIWSVVLLVLIYLFRAAILRVIDTQAPYKPIMWLCLFAGVACTSYLHAVVTTPIGSNNIYEQHWQMQRFVNEYYRAPVAVIDLGLVSYRNDRYVLDLWGLASKQALDYRQAGSDPAWMNQLAGQHDVKLAMVYDERIPQVPANWTKVGELHLGRMRITPLYRVVSFYTLDPELNTRTQSMLHSFQSTLPGDVKLVIGEGGSAAVK